MDSRIIVTDFLDKPVRLTHQFDSMFRARAVEELGIDETDEVSYSVLRAQQQVPVDIVTDTRYTDRSPEFYKKTYLAREIRLTHIKNGVIWKLQHDLFTVGTISSQILFADSYDLEDFCLKLNCTKEILDKRYQIQDRGVPYLESWGNQRDIYPAATGRIDNYIDEPVYLLYHHWGMMYGHFLQEICAEVSPWKTYLRHRGVKLLMPRLAEWQKKLLMSLGIDETEIIHLPSGTNTACRSLFFSHCFEFGHDNIPPELMYFPQATSFAVKPATRGRKIYAARTDSKNRRLVNEDELIARLKDKGFEIVVGGALSPEEQISLYAEASIVVGRTGANLTNIIFCSPGTALVEILAEDLFIPLYMRIANLVKMNYAYLMAPSVPGASNSWQDRECIVNVDEVVALAEHLTLREPQYASDRTSIASAVERE